MITKNAIFTKVKTAITTEYTSAYCTSERLYAPSRFPCVWIVEIDTYPELANTALDFTDVQRRSDFEIQVFSDKQVGAATEAASIMSVAIAEMRRLGYRCTSSSPLDNGVDASIKRHVARFTRFIGGGDTLPTD